MLAIYQDSPGDLTIARVMDILADQIVNGAYRSSFYFFTDLCIRDVGSLHRYPRKEPISCAATQDHDTDYIPTLERK